MKIKLSENDIITLNEISEKLVELYGNIEETGGYIKNATVPEHEILELVSLHGGYAGIALALGVFDKKNPNRGMDKIAFEYIKRCISIIQGNPTYSFSLFSGLTGILISLKFNSKNGQRYKNIIEQLLQIIADNYLEMLKISQNNLANNTITTDDFEVILGWSGILRGLIEFDNDFYDTDIKKVIKDVSEYLIDLGSISEKKPRWFINYEQLTDIEKESLEEGLYNNGMSHGIAGVLASLSILYLKGYRFNGLESSIENIRSWLLKNTLEHRNIEYIPNISLEKNNHRIFNHRDAWCYGTPGVSMAIYISAMTDNNLNIKEKSIELFKNFSKRNPEEHKLISPTICHGFAGMLMLCMRFIKYGVDDSEINEITNYVFKKMMNFYKENTTIMFSDYELIKGKVKKVDKIGLLEGVTGVFLVIQSLLYDENEWDQIFLLS